MKSAHFMKKLTLSLFLAAGVLSAQAEVAVSECKERIDLVQQDLDAINTASGIGGNNPQQTYASLTSKLQGSQTKLDKNKFPDAQQALQDFKTAVTTMRDAAKPKLSRTDAALLLDGDDGSLLDEGVNGAIICVALLPAPQAK